MRRAWLAFLLLVVSGSPLVAAYEFTGSAFVQDDGTIRIRNRTVHLWGILIPDTREDCVTYRRPLSCGPRAILALERKIEGFVRCVEMTRYHDGTFDARCFIDYGQFDDGIDLAAYLLNRGWAVALPAPRWTITYASGWRGRPARGSGACRW